MGRLTPVSRVQLIRRFKELGFKGPFSGVEHQFLLRENRRLILPNPHRHTIGVNLLARIVRQAGITREQWLGETG